MRMGISTLTPVAHAPSSRGGCNLYPSYAMPVSHSTVGKHLDRQNRAVLSGQFVRQLFPRKRFPTVRAIQRDARGRDQQLVAGGQLAFIRRIRGVGGAEERAGNLDQVRLAPSGN